MAILLWIWVVYDFKTIYGAGFIKRTRIVRSFRARIAVPTHKCRADAELSRVRVAVLGQPRGQLRNSLGRDIPAVYCIFRRNTAAYRMQRVVAAVQEWRRHCWNESVSVSPSCLLHSPRSVRPRLPDARNLDMPNCAPALVVSVSTTAITPSWLSQPPGCNSPATSQSASVPSWHAPSATAKRYQSVSAWEERGLRNQVDPLRPPSPHRPGPQQLHQLRLGR